MEACWIAPPISSCRLWVHLNSSCWGVRQRWLVIAALDYSAFWNRKYLWVTQLTLKSLYFPEIPIQEVINNSSSWMTLHSLVQLVRRRGIIWWYLHCSEKWWPVAWGFVFCFHGMSQVCVSLPDRTATQQDTQRCVSRELCCDADRRRWGCSQAQSKLIFPQWPRLFTTEHQSASSQSTKTGLQSDGSSQTNHQNILFTPFGLYTEISLSITTENVTMRATQNLKALFFSFFKCNLSVTWAVKSEHLSCNGDMW